MSKMSNLKQKWEYDRDTPRCDSCKHFRETYIKLTTDSNTRRVHQHCDLGGFNVRRVGLCNKWLGRQDGATLE